MTQNNIKQWIGWNWVNSDIQNDAWWRKKVIEDYSLFHGMFSFDIPNKYWIIEDDGVEKSRTEDSIRVSQKNWGASINSWTTVWQSWDLRSKRHPKYQPNKGILFSWAWFLPDSTKTGWLRRWGLFTEESGVFFELWIDAKLYAVRRKCNHQIITATAWQTVFLLSNIDILATSTVYVRIEAVWEVEYLNTTAFTVDDATDTITLDSWATADDKVAIVVVDDNKEEILEQKLKDIQLDNWVADLSYWHLFDIQMQWRGQGDYFFYINQKLVYTMKILWTLQTTSITNPSLPCRYEADNISAGGENFEIFISCSDLSSEGWNRDRKEGVSITNWIDEVTCDDSGLTVLLVAYIPYFFEWRHNTRDFVPINIYAWSETNRWAVRVLTTRDITAFTGLTTQIEKNQGSSLLYYKGDGTMKIIEAKVEELISRAIPVNDSKNIKFELSEIDNYLSHGDYLIVVWQCNKANNDCEMSASLELWEEL